MADREKNFWDRITAALWRSNRVLNRIENGVLDGMPDSYFTIDGTSGWIELKCPIEPARESTALFSGNHKLSIAQANWLLSHRQAGGRGFIAIETQNWCMLVGARNADFVNKWTLQQAIVYSDFATKRPLGLNGWNEFTSALLKKEIP